MGESSFRTSTGVVVPMVTAEEMREIDRVATCEVVVGLLQMMENAGRMLAWHVRALANEPVVVVAGNGGNGGGGLVCARHLANRGTPVTVWLDREPRDLTGAAATQVGMIDAMGLPVKVGKVEGFPQDSVVVDALIGYGLRGDVQGAARGLIDRVNDSNGSIVSLDVPSGVDATSGAVMGHAVRPVRTVTLALPKTGLVKVDGELVLADIGLPKTVFERAGVTYESPFGPADWVELVRS